PVGTGFVAVAARRAARDRDPVDLRHPAADRAHDARHRPAPAAHRHLLPAARRLLRLGMGAQRRRLPAGAEVTTLPRSSSLFRAALARTEGPALGTWVKLPAMESIELIALAGFDFVVIDMEHSALDLETVSRHIGVALLTGVAPIVRVPGLDGGSAQRVLDAGAE